ncbi:MAG: hypothetical protein K2O18_15095 [Oscillospiraceae bacterium]|nr:hypothetical protein [Oscillospiraceae bacterium]
MKPLIEITTVPIQIEMKTTHAKLEYTRGTVEAEISHTEESGLKIQSKPARVNIDTYEARNSLTPTLARQMENQAKDGMQTAKDASSTFAQQGMAMMKTKLGEEVITKFAEQTMLKNYRPEIAMDFIPKGGAKISADPGELNIQYELDKLNFDWKVKDKSFEFTPGNIEFTVTQRPEVHVEYVGGPVYAPPSADPNYEPRDIPTPV